MFLRLPYELLTHIALYLKPRRFPLFTQLARAFAPLCNDETVFRKLFRLHYNSQLESSDDWLWKDLFVLAYRLNLTLKLSLRNRSNYPNVAIDHFCMYRSFRPAMTAELYTGSSNTSCLGFILDYHFCINESGEFFPRLLQFPSRSAKLYAVNFEHRARQVKRQIEGVHEAFANITHINGEPMRVKAPFQKVLFIYDGLCVWSPTLVKYVLIYSMADIYKRYEEIKRRLL
jgi:hypothetical protein